jgi:hypothetical protein
MATLLRAWGAAEIVEPARGRGFALGELQALVGGYIQVVRAPAYLVDDDGGPLFLVLNEDGKRLDLPLNPMATVLWHQAGGALDDLVVGDVVIASRVELDEPDEEEI